MWYKEGTVSVENGSSTVTGSAPVKFIWNSRVGDGFVGPDGKLYEVVNVLADNILGISPAYMGATETAAEYLIIPVQGYTKLAADRLHQITAGMDDIEQDVNDAQASAAAALASEIAAAGHDTAASASATASQASAAESLSHQQAAATNEANSAASAASSLAYRNDAQAAKTVAETARDEAVAAAGTVTGVLSELGNIDLSGGAYPPTPPAASFWKVTVGGTVAGIEYGVGDSLVYSKTTDSFYKIDSTESVTSVGGFQGVVSKEQLGIDQVSNTSDADKPISTAQQAAIDLKFDKADVVDDVVTDDAAKALSAKQGKFLYELLQSNNVSAVAYKFITTQGQTTLSGADSTGKNLVYTPGAVMLVTGQGLDYWQGYDYTATNGTSIVFTEAFEEGEQIGVVVFGTFSLADHYTKAEDDAKFVDKAQVIDLAHGGTGGTTAPLARQGLGLGSAAVANIVGTVSQVGGVPTGAIVESGSNSNGQYTKYADGTMICSRTVSLGSVAITSAFGNVYYAPAGLVAMGYAIGFSTVPAVSMLLVGNSGLVWMSSAGGSLPTTTSWPTSFPVSAQTQTTTLTLILLAVGRWY